MTRDESENLAASSPQPLHNGRVPSFGAQRWTFSGLHAIEMANRMTFTAAFEAWLALRGDRTAQQIAVNCGVHPN